MRLSEGPVPCPFTDSSGDLYRFSGEDMYYYERERLCDMMW